MIVQTSIHSASHCIIAVPDDADSIADVRGGTSDVLVASGVLLLDDMFLPEVDVFGTAGFFSQDEHCTDRKRTMKIFIEHAI